MPAANVGPIVAAVIAAISGLVIGEASQNAMIGASGTRAASSPATSGNTVIPQTGVSAPIKPARPIMRSSRPRKAAAIKAIAPEAVIAAVRPTATAMTGAIRTRFQAANRAAAMVCSGSTATASNPAAIKARYRAGRSIP